MGTAHYVARRRKAFSFLLESPALLTLQPQDHPQPIAKLAFFRAKAFKGGPENPAGEKVDFLS
jgi:hypothetical protein